MLNELERLSTDHDEVDQTDDGAKHARLEARLAEEAALGELLVLISDWELNTARGKKGQAQDAE